MQSRPIPPGKDLEQLVIVAGAIADGQQQSAKYCKQTHHRLHAADKTLLHQALLML
jgi:hypothetical protein